MWWVTKHALFPGKGIFLVDLEPSKNRPEYLFSAFPAGIYKAGSTAFDSQEEAVKAAEVMREKEVKRLESEIERLKNLDFWKQP